MCLHDDPTTRRCSRSTSGSPHSHHHDRTSTWLAKLRRRWILGTPLIAGALALGWLVLRSGSSPRRFTYPCQQAAFSTASLAFGAPLVGAVLAIRSRSARSFPRGVSSSSRVSSVSSFLASRFLSCALSSIALVIIMRLTVGVARFRSGSPAVAPAEAAVSIKGSSEASVREERSRSRTGTSRSRSSASGS